MTSTIEPKEKGIQTDVEKKVNPVITFIKGDITTQSVDAIVNAANESLLGGGGVDGAIHSAAGDQLYEECKTLGGCDTGDAKITKGYNLPATYVIHAVGPDYDEWSPAEAAKLLESCYRSSLEIAEEYGLKTIAFPSISTGIFAFPKLEAARIVHVTVSRFLQNVKSLKEVRFVLYSQEDLDIYEREFRTDPHLN